jgi:hypothetical protein
MFTLDVSMPEVEAAMFAQGAGVVADMDIWHKRIGHVNEQQLKFMQSSEIVTGLPKFKVDGSIRYVKHVNLGNKQRMCFRMTRM